MSVSRTARPLAALARTSIQPVVRTYFTAPRVPAPAPSAVLRPTLSLSSRWKSTVTRSNFSSNPIITYDELKPLTEQPTDEILLVDVRERDENMLGSIPSAVNLPLSELKEALDPKTNPGDFQKKYIFSKPLPSQDMIFFCRSGKRSATAAEQAGERGYHNIRNYKGSYLDWTKNEQGKMGGDDDD